MAATRAMASPMCRPSGCAGSSGTDRLPHSAANAARRSGCSSSQADSFSVAGGGAARAACASALSTLKARALSAGGMSGFRSVRGLHQAREDKTTWLVRALARPTIRLPMSQPPDNSFDVIIVGGGHAGTEAALAAARMGARTLLLTQSLETLGQMSCNPAVGGIGKGHLVREIDALGGAMAAATDEAGIQFRTLNASKGPAVRATRAQADRVLYRQAIRTRLENQPGLALFQQEVADLEVTGGRVHGVVTVTGIRFCAKAVVLTVGTFLGGRVHVGLDQYSGGRAGDAASQRLAARLRELPLRVGRLKTGTPPRIDGRTVDFARLLRQPGDLPTPVFSFLGRSSDHPSQVDCFITNTNERTHDIIRAATDRSPMFTGLIQGVGPRYCPSVEDKVVRFADKHSHQ